MQLFYEANIAKDYFVLNKEESVHCVKVLRKKEGDKLIVVNGKGVMLECLIEQAHPKGLHLKVVKPISETYQHRDFHVHIGIAPTKNISRFEWFLEKATEIGVDLITPILCEHSERKKLNHERLNKILISAMKQSQQAYLPVLNDWMRFSNFIKDDFNGRQLIAHCEEQDKSGIQKKYNRGEDVLILIGPEGDFSPQEIKEALSIGYEPISLGKNRLRTETAGIVACQTIQIINEDL